MSSAKASSKERLPSCSRWKLTGSVSPEEKESLTRLDRLDARLDSIEQSLACLQGAQDLQRRHLVK
jgi:hypothetical protein